jgi:hypothetical protein
MRGTTVAFTSCNLAYLDRASVLLRTVREMHPAWSVVLVLVDEMPVEEALLAQLDGFDEVILPGELGLRDLRRWLFGHDIVEACTAVKGVSLLRLLERGADVVIYLDPDMALLAPLTPVVDALESSPIVLTPHQLRPASTMLAVVDNELGSLLTGVYNLGFLAVRRGPTGLAFAGWWADRLRDFCLDDPARGLFTDQRWMDLAPVFFPELHVLRDPGMNVASWNLVDREVHLDEHGDFRVDGSLLRMFHFSKALGAGPVMTLRYAEGNVRVAELWRWYLAALATARRRLGNPPVWAWSSYADGVEIAPEHRRIYRERPDLHDAYPDPYDAGLREWMTRHADVAST